MARRGEAGRGEARPGKAWDPPTQNGDNTMDTDQTLWTGSCECGERYVYLDHYLRNIFPMFTEAFDDGAFITACTECHGDVTLERRTVQSIPLHDTLTTPTDGCPECGVDHEAWKPHDQQSMVYRYTFRQKHGHWPTWHDAMAHCSDEVKAAWTQALATHGINPDQP